ncbi:MAG: sulfatase [Deltaproteobacteria bacterium]|nr:sulfatase [Deltaproteobacteria bacterium]
MRRGLAPRTGTSPTALAVLALAVSLLGACDRPRFDVRPNVVLITVDTLRADRLGSYGYADARTPHMDRLAREGVRFGSASTVIPRTSQSIASIMTGLYPHEHGSLEIGTGPDDGVLLASQLFSDAGYATAGVSANGAASRTQGLERGFDHFVGWRELGRRHTLWGDPPPRGGGPYVGRAEAVTREAVAWIEQERDEPFFLWLLYFDPHFFYNPPPPYRDVIDWSGFDYYREVQKYDPKNATIYFDLNGRASELLPQVTRLYDAEVTYTDAVLGAFLDLLAERRASGADPRPTLIVLTADHGESLGEHAYYYEHGDFVWETTMRVPLILHAPGVIPEGLELDFPTTTLDVLPTVLGLIDLPAPEGVRFSGRDLSGAIFDGASAPLENRVIFGESGSALIPQNPHRLIGGTLTSRKVKRYLRDGRWLALRHRDTGFALYDAEADPYLRDDIAAREPEVAGRMRELLDRVSVFGSRWRTARDSRWKLVRIPGLTRSHELLFDLAADPGETRDVSDTHPGERERLSAALDAWLATIPSDAGGVRTETDPERARELEEQLRSLGYVD